MKIILALAALLSAAPVSAALAQQTGRVPVPAPARPGSAATSTPTEPANSEAASSETSTESSSRPSAVPLPAPRRSAGARPQTTTILLELETSRPEGRIAVAIYRDADSFRHSRNPVRVMMLDRDHNGPVTRAYVQGLTPGRYAIAAFQDIDGDGKLSKGALGIPREPFGFSNDARARFGSPTFEAASFNLGASGVTQRIVLRDLMSTIRR